LKTAFFSEQVLVIVYWHHLLVGCHTSALVSSGEAAAAGAQVNPYT